MPVQCCATRRLPPPPLCSSPLWADAMLKQSATALLQNAFIQHTRRIRGHIHQRTANPMCCKEFLCPNSKQFLVRRMQREDSYGL
ncbi:hypothetical protein JZ751_022980 [Albula glossodonta]|uniref:Uncharacterized protein n=1 Tax=Albula glossodonta TaxID=121402 RepID=A0A8T2PHR7_9TELE|nr:hypothetical protein JZ751_022980 [Albula glossodonta]